MDGLDPDVLRVVEKPWGREIWWAVTDHYLGKRLEVRAGASLSLQFHRWKVETLYLHAGRIRLHLGGRAGELPVGAAVTILPGTIHRVEALHDSVLFEVSTPHPEDVVRLEDDYGRAP